MSLPQFSLADQFEVVKAYKLPERFQVPTFDNDYVEDAPVWYEIKAVADFNSDGLDDVVVHTVDGYAPVSILASNADGTLSPLPTTGDEFVRHHIRYGDAGDVNLDGVMDFAGFEASHQMSDQRDIVIYGSRSNQLSAVEPLSHDEVGNHGGAIGDFNADGLPDVFGIREFGETYFEYLDNAADPRQPSLQRPLGELVKGQHALPAALDDYRIADAVVSDLDRDGYDDVLLAIQTDRVTRGGEPADYASMKDSPVAAIVWGEQDVLLQDREVDYFGDHWMSRSDFTAFEEAFGETINDAIFGALKIGVVNLHDSPDLEIIVNSVWQNGFVQRGGGFEVFKYREGEFVDITDDLFPNLETQEAPGSLSAHGFHTGDINLDGNTDLIVQTAGYLIEGEPGHHSVFLGQSDGTFLPIKAANGYGGLDAFNAGENIPLNHASIGDFNGDGVDDIVVEGDAEEADGSYSDYLYVLLNKGEGRAAEKVFGTEADDTLEVEGKVSVSALMGDDMVRNLGDGLVTSQYSGPRSNFKIESDGEAFTVTDTVGRQGTDRLEGVGRLEFSDVHVALDTDGAAGMAYRLYEASFDRIPDAMGVGFWIGRLDSGMSSNEVAARFIDSAEFRALYGTDVADGDFVETLYRNILDRTPEAQGYDWWVNELASGARSRAEVLAGFADSKENRDHVADMIATGIEYVSWDEMS
jgi:hypothetical protein